MLQFLAVAFPLEAIAPAVAMSIYVPLTLLRGLGLPVFTAAESGGWAAPSLFGWAIVAIFWTILWWSVASFVGYFVGRRIDHA
ncbi:hypothetical protein ASE07_11275 [Noviherbaspirillum sp. Root189]|nr:hypothetical protein ASE07_11275 [Noviherbaspirillum sp. Root189]